MKSPSLDSKSLSALVPKAAATARKYAVPAFLLVLLGIYGFLGWKILTYANAQPSADSVSSAAQTARVPKVDPQLVDKIQKLQDNSVRVQTIFNQARSNPFQEEQ